MKLEQVIQEEMSFKEKVYARRTDGRRTNTGHNSSPLAQVSLKKVLYFITSSELNAYQM